MSGGASPGQPGERDAPRLWVDTSSPIPPYEQIRAQVAAFVAAGTLAPGSRLPSVRQLAADLGLAAGTVARAYRELEATGVVETRRRTGTHVAAQPMVASPPGDALSDLAGRFVAEATAAGATPDEILTAVARKLRGCSSPGRARSPR
jgi:GntR family transcriptional regulator